MANLAPWPGLLRLTQGRHLTQPVAEPHFLSRDRFCSVARTLEILSDAWIFLVLRESFFGARRFEQFQIVLQLPRNTLVIRLRKLTELGLMHKVSYSAGTTRFEYRLTDRGLDLYPTMLALMKFGDRWLSDALRPPLQLVHSKCSHACLPLVVCSSCKEIVDAHAVLYSAGPGAGSEPRAHDRKRSRRTSDPLILERVRPCSVARTLRIIGDRWSFLLIREMFFGVRRFDAFEANIGIATNILTDRLQRLAGHGIVERRAYQSRPQRFEYRFTPKGRDLYGSLIVMMHWGDQWLSGGRAPLILRHHPCQQEFFAQVVCSACRQTLEPRQTTYQLRYALAS